MDKSSRGEICVANFIPPVNGVSLGSYFDLKVQYLYKTVGVCAYVQVGRYESNFMHCFQKLKSHQMLTCPNSELEAVNPYPYPINRARLSGF